MQLPALASFVAGRRVAIQMLRHAQSREYHLLDLGTGVSYGGFISLEAARIIAREHGLTSWQIFHGDKRVEHHDPEAA
jgi:hypothetical protein